MPLSLDDAVTWAQQSALEPPVTAGGPPWDATKVLARTTGESDAVRRWLAWFAWQMYRGHQLPFLTGNPDEPTREFERRPGKTQLNLTRLVIDVLSGLYQQPPRRTIDGPPAVARAAQRVWEHAALDAVLLNVDRATRLLGTVAVRPCFHDGRLHYWLYPAHQLRVLPDPAFPWAARAVVTDHRTTRRSTGRARTVHVQHVFTPTHFARLEDGALIETRAHPYGRLPFAFFRDRLDFEGFWASGRGVDLAARNAGINQKLSDLAYTVKMQGFGVLELTNPDPNQEIALSPGRAIAFRVSASEPAGIAFKHPDAPIRELIEDVRFDIEQLLLAHRVPQAALTVALNAAPSGVAIVASQTPVLEDRAERAVLFRRAEADLLDATLRVLQAHDPTFTGVTSPERYRFHVDFKEPTLSVTPEARRADDAFKLAHGLVTPWELMQRDNPDAYADLQDARRAYLENRRALAEAVAAEPAPDARAPSP